MNNKLFKTGLAISSLGAVVAPVATAISCGGNSTGRYDAPDDKKLVLLSNFLNTGTNTKQWNAIKKQIDEYNKLSSLDRNGYSAELRHSDGISKTLSTTYESQDKNKIANMAIDYPDTLGLVSKYDQQLDLSKTNPKLDLSSTFPSQFTDINNNIGGLEDGTYLVPITKSTELLAINKPLLGYMLETVGYDTTSTATKVQEYVNEWKTVSKTPTDTFTVNEKDAILKSYPIKKGYTKATNKFDDTIFKDGSKMLDFAIEVSKAFNISNNSDANTKSFAFGIDSATNFIYNSINAKINGDASKFLFKKDPDTGYIKYQFNNPNVKNIFKEIWNKMKEAIDGGSLFFAGSLNNKKEYGSTFLSSNRMAISIGSTAGYSYLYKNIPTLGNKKYDKKYDVSIVTQDDIDQAKDKMQESELFALKPFHFWNGSTGKGSTLIQGPSLIALHVNETEDNATSKFINWFITKPTLGNSPLDTFTQEGGYISPTTSNLSVASNPYSSTNKGNEIAWQELKDVKDNNLNGFDNPVDDTTGTTRNDIQDAIYEQYVQKIQKSSNKATDIDGLYDIIKKGFSGKFE